LLAPGMSVDDIARGHDSQEDFINAFFNTSAFRPVSQIPLGTYGDVPKGAIYGPAQSKSDIAVSRFFSLPGRDVRLQFRGELFNAFNQVNFNNPNTTANSANFGRITGADAPRIGQVALKVLW
jgi:hypothetical protein